MSRSGLPQLLLLATGGTIAGCADNSATLNDYTAGVLGGDALIAAVPQLQELATISVEQVANVDSADLQFDHWRRLVARIRDAFATDPELAGVVITHGTNTLEETAWLLQLLIDDPRPGAAGSDAPGHGPQCRWAIGCRGSVAASPGAGRVLVVMDGQIHGARDVTKVATQGVGAFASPGRGSLGWVDDAGVHLPRASRSRQVPFAALALPEPWPQVAILYGSVQPESWMLRLSRSWRAGSGVHWHRRRPVVGWRTPCVGGMGWTTAADAAGQPLWVWAGAPSSRG